MKKIMLEIFPAETNEDLEIVKEIFIEYANFLNEILGEHKPSRADYYNQKILSYL